MSNMEDNVTEEVTVPEQMLEQAVEEALKVPAPTEEPKRKPFLHEQAAWDLRQGLKKKFRPGSKKKLVQVPKLDAEDKEIPHGNGGLVYVMQEMVSNE